MGESGCGKTTTGRCILRLYKPTAGTVSFNGADISHMRERELKPIRRDMGAIFQDPFSSLNPRQTAGSIISDPLKVHHMSTKQQIDEMISELFKMVGLDPRMTDRVPHEFSGGQRQRIGIARALACRPSLVICDEPISARRYSSTS